MWTIWGPEGRKLHNQIVTQLKRVHKYLERGIDVQIDDAIKSKFLPELYPEITAPATKRQKV